MRVARLAYWTLRALPADKRVTILRDAIAGGEALATMSRVMGILGQEHGKYQGGATTPEKEPLLTLEEQEELEQLVLNRIRTYSQGYRLLEVPRLPNILYRWRDWSNLDEPRNWVAKVITEPERLPRLLEPFVTVSYSKYVDDAVGKRKVSLDWDALKEFSEMKVLIESANQIPSSQRLTKNQALAVDLLKHWPTSITSLLSTRL